jgi:hypothetical protein
MAAKKEVKKEDMQIFKILLNVSASQRFSANISLSFLGMKFRGRRF